MNTVSQVMAELQKMGSEKTRATYARHCIAGDVYGVSIADLKTVVKQIKGNQALACALYETGNYDAKYLAGLVADGSRMTKKELEAWAKTAAWGAISEYTVSWVASESEHARELANKWIDSKQESIATSGWCTWGGIVAMRPDEELDLEEINGLLNRVVKQIDAAPNKVRYTMNGFVIAVGAYVKPLLKQAKAAATKIGAVSVDMGDTACKVPLALEYIAKIESAGRVEEAEDDEVLKCESHQPGSSGILRVGADSSREHITIHPQGRAMATFSDIVEATDNLSLDEQEALVQILRRRIAETNRAALVCDVAEARAEFRGGQSYPASVDDITAGVRGES